jgi:hypothetical protein
MLMLSAFIIPILLQLQNIFRVYFSFRNIFDELVKSHYLDGTVKSAKCKACESCGMRRTYSTLQ